jgi:hypothetical protein
MYILEILNILQLDNSVHSIKLIIAILFYIDSFVVQTFASSLISSLENIA